MKNKENLLEPRMPVEVSALLVQPPWPPSVPPYCYALLAQLPWHLQLYYSALLALPPWPPSIGRHGPRKAWVLLTDYNKFTNVTFVLGQMWLGTN